MEPVVNFSQWSRSFFLLTMTPADISGYFHVLLKGGLLAAAATQKARVTDAERLAISRIC